MTTLNPNAAVFVPMGMEQVSQEQYWVYEDEEGEPTEAELEELEAVDAWVDLMAELEEQENEHIIAVALQYAPAAAQVLEEEALAERKREQQHHGRKGKGHATSQE